MIEVEILHEVPQWQELDDVETLIEQAAKAALQVARNDNKGLGGGPFVVALKLSDDAQLRQLNKQFRGKDKATNVLSFPLLDEFAALHDGPTMLGDIILSHETLQREAKEQGQPLAHHLAHLVIHGVLHLLGHDHQEDAEAERMESLERQALAHLQIPPPIATAK